MAEDDPTARRSLDLEFERIANFGVWQRVIATGEQEWTPGTHRVFGLPPDQPPSREVFLSLLHPEDLPVYWSAIRRLEQDGEPFSINLRITRLDGEIRLLHALGFRGEGTDGEGPRLVGTVQDITRANALETERARLLEKILRTTDDERRRLAGRVHDDVIPELAVALRRADAPGDELDQELLESVRTPILAAIDRLREILADLDPPDVTARQFPRALGRYADRVMPQGTDVSIAVADVGHASRLTLATALRIAREAISNAARHAAASRILVEVGVQGHELHTTVQDDGVGFDLDADHPDPSRHMGVRLMRQRAGDLGGDLDISTAPGEGTTVSFRLPLDPVTEQLGPPA